MKSLHGALPPIPDRSASLCARKREARFEIPYGTCSLPNSFRWVETQRYKQVAPLGLKRQMDFYAPIILRLSQ